MQSNTIHLLYFVCGRHFECLRVSLRSLRAVGLECVGTVYLYVDRDDFFTDSQIALLRRMVPRLVIRKSDHKTTGLGEQAIANQLRAFLRVGEEIGEDDYLAKVDSDILFVSDQVFHDVLRSGDDAVGQVCDYWEPFLFFQGGCYFLKGSVLSEFATFDRSIMPAVLASMNNETARKQGKVFTTYTEDAVVYSFLKTRTDRVVLRSYYGEEHDLYDLRNSFSMIHFQQTRDVMLNHATLNEARLWLRRRLLRAGNAGRVIMLSLRAAERLPGRLIRGVRKALILLAGLPSKS